MGQARRTGARADTNLIGAMAYVTVQNAQAGMVLAAEVTDRRGRLLIPAGKELSAKHVRALRMWGVSHVEVQGEPAACEPAAPLDPEARVQIEAELDQHFRNTDQSHPFIKELRRICAARRVRFLDEQGEPRS